MTRLNKDLKFHSMVYEMAALIHNAVIHPSSFIEVRWEDPVVASWFYKYSKITLLQHYIIRTIAVHYSREFQKNCDYYCEDDIVAEIEKIFQIYGIEFTPFNSFCSQNYNEADTVDMLAEWFYSWFQDQSEHFDELWEIITDEVFQLLFGNRTFLLNFNQSLANYFCDNQPQENHCNKFYPIQIPNEYLNKKGFIERRAIPSWVKKAVFFRDHGRCVLCHKDLSGLLNSDYEAHYDHIVPLNKWGTNSATNIQLLCKDCNLKKSDKPARTGTMYPTWWNYDEE